MLILDCPPFHFHDDSINIVRWFYSHNISNILPFLFKSVTSALNWALISELFYCKHLPADLSCLSLPSPQYDRHILTSVTLKTHEIMPFLYSEVSSERTHLMLATSLLTFAKAPVYLECFSSRVSPWLTLSFSFNLCL